MIALASLILAFARLDTPKIDISTPELAVQYCTLRYFASNPTESAPEGLAEGIKLMRAIDDGLPDAITLRSGERKAKSATDRRVKDLYWSLLDSQVLSATTLASFKLRLGMLPTKIGGNLDTKSTFSQLTAALDATEKPTQIEWTSNKSKVDLRLAEWQASAEPKLNSIYAFLSESLNVKKLPAKVKVIVVPLLSGKGGITLRSIDGPIVVIGCNRFEGADFDEVLIHETIHALDSIESNVGIFSTMRQDFAELKIDSTITEQVVHTMVFMHAAEAVRRTIDPRHKDVGETFGIYEKGLQKYFDILKEPLQKLWAKELSEKDFVHSVAAKVAHA